MARVGRFGRRRSSGQNLTVLISSLLREQRQAEDRAARDAWANGGKFKGEDMTDARYIGYLKGRRDMFSTDDPLYDQFNNEVIQTEFSIGEQKIGLAFKQGKVGAGAVAAFYRGQLSKIPSDSAFYREVAGRAAEWAKSAAGAARSAGRARAKKAAEAKLDGLRATISTHDALVGAVTQEAKRRGLISGNQTLFDADATDLTGMFENFVVNGQSVTFDDWRESSLSAYGAMTAAVPVYETLGRSTATLNEDRQKFLNGYLSNLNAIDDRKKYEYAREIWQDRVDSAQGDPFLTAQYTQDYVSSLTNIYNQGLTPTGLEENNADFLGALTNEITALQTGKLSGPTPMDLIEGGTQDAVSSAATSANLQAAIGMLNNGQAYYGQSEPGGALEVIPYPPNAGFDAFGRNGLGDDVQQTVMKVGGQTRVVYLKGAPVKGAILRAPDGTALDTSTLDPATLPDLLSHGYYPDQADTVVGYVFQKPGAKAPTYGIYDSQGDLKFTEDNPFTTGLYGAGDELVVIGNSVLDAKGNPTLDPGSVIANPNAQLSPLPVGPEIGQSDINSLLANAGVTALGLAPEKATAYESWRAGQAAAASAAIGAGSQPVALDHPKQMGGSLKGGSASPAQSMINAALAAAQASLSAFTRNMPPDQLNPIPTPGPQPGPAPTTPYVLGPLPFAPQTAETTTPQSLMPTTAQTKDMATSPAGYAAATASWTPAVQKFFDQQKAATISEPVNSVNPLSSKTRL